ncbi:TetR/AcrR family transcriptional regulator [Sciscionella marina]|uniref:TetR/AcrR family transcriptional regulator n=1 Tax=Sciscionella marina TaxID=508770 RepID=UPI000378DDD3|nr:TetR/AcrR family transcriptional regulator [Sciscionella marina]
MSETRTEILVGALGLLRAEGTVSLDSAAQRAGLTKAGLMHYFHTKQALMLALVDHVVDRWEQRLTGFLSGPPGEATARDRVLAYLDWTLSTSFDCADLIMLADPRLRSELTARWRDRLGPWINPAADTVLSAGARARLSAVRMLADGVWLADATEVFPLAAEETEHVRAAALRLLEDPNDRGQHDPGPTDADRTMRTGQTGR